MKKIQFLVLILSLFVFNILISASDRSVAFDLQKKSKHEAKLLKIAVSNFGSKQNKVDYKKGMKNIKMGSVKLLQNNFLDAQTQFKKYFKLQYSIYKSLAQKYIKRTKKIIDDVAMDLVDDIDNKKVEKYIKLAAQNLGSAKNSSVRKHYSHVVNACRIAKKYAFEAYQLIGKKLPKKYTKDRVDCLKKVYKK